MTDKYLIIFVKNLIPGMVKTRLAESIGIDAALDVYMQLVRHTHQITKKLEGVDKIVYYSEYVEIEDVWDPELFKHHVQKGNDLGEKMSNAFDEAFDSYNKVVIIGSDCYELTTKQIQEAYDQLENNDLVVGPASDGGYYLLGMKEFLPQLFKDKNYSTDKVLDDLLQEAADLELDVHKLPVLNDIDTIEDLKESGIAWESFGEMEEGAEEDDAY